jgi:hypothetical protein
MASGQQKAQKNVESFQLWSASMTEQDFVQITHRGKLNRAEVAKSVGCAKSALTQNPRIRQLLKDLEDSLRKRKILPPATVPTSVADKNDAIQYDQKANKNVFDSKRLTQLEQENIALKAELAELENKNSKLERKFCKFIELNEALLEFSEINNEK